MAALKTQYTLLQPPLLLRASDLVIDEGYLYS